MKATLASPLAQILNNCGVGLKDDVVNYIKENGGGYDAKNDKYVDMLEEGIIDPKKVTRIALENAASVAGMILTTECALIQDEDPMGAMPPMGGMPGMPGMM